MSPRVASENRSAITKEKQATNHTKPEQRKRWIEQWRDTKEAAGKWTVPMLWWEGDKSQRKNAAKSPAAFIPAGGPGPPNLFRGTVRGWRWDSEKKKNRRVNCFCSWGGFYVNTIHSCAESLQPPPPPQTTAKQRQKAKVGGLLA